MKSICPFVILFCQMNNVTVIIKYVFTIDKVGWLDPRRGKHWSIQVGRVNQGIIRSLWGWISVWIRFRWHSDFIFPQINPFWFLQTEMSFNFTLFISCCLALVPLLVLLSKVYALIHLIFSDVKVTWSYICKQGFLTDVTRPRLITNSFTRGKPILWHIEE